MATAFTPTRAGSPLGRPTDRIDGPRKVGGHADYAAEHFPPGVVHAVLVQSTVGNGRVARVDHASVESMPGVLAVISHRNAPKIATPKVFPMGAAASSFVPFQDDRVRYNGQHVALVVADTLEHATAAGRALAVEYAPEPAVSGIADPKAEPKPAADFGGQAPDAEWGDPDAALADAPVRLDLRYTTPREYNAPIEPHATVAQWGEDGSLTVWEPSQWVEGARQVFSEWFGLPLEKIRVISPFIGGGFGCKACPQPHAAAAVLAAKMVGRPVKLAVTRPQMFTSHGGRAATRQTLSIGADRDGKLQAIVQESVNETSLDDAFVEPGGSVTALMYGVPNLRTTHKLVRCNVVTPGWMRAPGEAVSSFALECAMDELAHELGLDPIELRLRNWTDTDPHGGKPWSTRRLREAYEAGVRAIGWERRSTTPRSVREGRKLVGIGMAAGTYPVMRTPSEALVRVTADGEVQVESGGTDIGTGLYTICAQTAAEVLGVDAADVRVRLGDTELARAPLAGGSQLSGDLLPVIHGAAERVRDELLQIAARELQANDLAVEGGRVIVPGDPSRAVGFADLVRRSGKNAIEVLHDNLPPDANSEEDRRLTFNGVSKLDFDPSPNYAMHSWQASFVEVHVDEDFGTVRVKRIVSAVDCGRLYNPKTAESQIQGGVIMGLGMALLEAAEVDPTSARITNNNLAEYMLPVHADVPDIEVISVGEPDYEANPLGGKCVGELGITGIAAAIANAVFNATGKRVRDLPITLEKLI
ncbi:xanthine dehydrogenase family protein molybdopterin-binding subunit [Sphingomonas lenta]|uniref:Oxidoreductase n=1 Tax=Sphingomonas lenta TaxID=1141887 RepID=A0A2A2SHP5_9SPHN|nr:xanthine dehydrogenase family protein molybdopterin-binding subunit [Sphingomonas lenta]PAX08814.1 oxidoreductase [Sphingomonas lenta]